MDSLEENLENIPSDFEEMLDDYNVSNSERDSDTQCDSVNDKKLVMNGDGCGATPTTMDKWTWLSNFFSVPLFILYEIKDFLLAQVLGIRFFVFVLQLLFNSWDFSTDAFKGVPVDEAYLWFFCALEFVLSVDPENPRRRRVIFKSGLPAIISQMAKFTLFVTLAPLSVSLPIFVHGRHQQTAFCSKSSAGSVPITLQRFAKEHSLVTVGRTDVINWCNVSSSIFPPFYSAIQSKYWQVSMFGYWQLTKVPCFLMAGPAFFIVVFGTYRTWCRVWSKRCVISSLFFCLIIIISNHICLRLIVLQYFSNKFHYVPKFSTFATFFVFRSFLHLLAESGDHVPYTLHALFMAFGALFVYNVEVLTRVLFSSSPFPYLVLARWISDITPKVTLALVTHFILENNSMVFVSHDN
ncbi:unnamed protein product [Angiostrongylus costaricensis]|uniref:GPI mannosyltransferase 2 n=1 Tax=Angiostrongylus costaricensis TaxID=334426 RepID=A0A0R3PZG7_ANGCS|nr:unnamed protein product [Angiostrongylus costaricensis]